MDIKRKYGEYFLILVKYVEFLHFIIDYELKTERREIAIAWNYKMLKGIGEGHGPKILIFSNTEGEGHGLKILIFSDSEG